MNIAELESQLALEQRKVRLLKENQRELTETLATMVGVSLNPSQSAPADHAAMAGSEHGN